MAIHVSSWAGIEILVFGNTPTVPMQYELAISEASPSMEIKVSSFERYEDAYDYSKKNSNVGLIILEEKCEPGDALQIFNNLSATYEEQRGPCYGVIIHNESGPSIHGLSLLRFSKGKFIDYLPPSDFLDQSKVVGTLQRIWANYTDAFEERLLPAALRETIEEIIGPLESARCQFANRLSMLFATRLRVSFLEAIAIRLSFLLDPVDEKDPKLASSLQRLTRVRDILGNDWRTLSSLESTASSKIPLASRACALIKHLSESDSELELTSKLEAIRSHVRPGGPGLMKQVSQLSDNILRIGIETICAPKSTLRKVG